MLRFSLPLTPTATLTRNCTPFHPVACPHRSPFVNNRFPSSPFLLSAQSGFRLRLLQCSTTGQSQTSAAAVVNEGEKEDGFALELQKLLALLPKEIRDKVLAHPELHQLVEIVMDLGRKPLARFPSGDFVLSGEQITLNDLNYATSQVCFFAR